MTNQLDSRVTTLDCLSLESNNLKRIPLPEINIYLSCSKFVSLANCLMRNIQIKQIFSLLPQMSKLVKLNLTKIDLTGLDKLDVTNVVGIKHLTVSKHLVLVSQLVALLRSHSEHHQENSWDLQAKCI